MGWRIDIKSEEEKRQEVETAMAALVSPGTPISVLIDHGLSDNLVEKLNEAGTSTVERLSDMTPEQLEEIQGIGPKMVEKIQLAVQAYYAQFEEGAAEEAAGEELAPESGPAEAAGAKEAGEAAAEPPAESGPVDAAAPQETGETTGESPAESPSPAPQEAAVDPPPTGAAESDKIGVPDESRVESTALETEGEEREPGHPAKGE